MLLYNDIVLLTFINQPLLIQNQKSAEQEVPIYFFSSPVLENLNRKKTTNDADLKIVEQKYRINLLIK